MRGVNIRLHGAWLVDLAPLGDPLLVPSALATVLGLEIRTKDPLPGLGLRDKRMLLLLGTTAVLLLLAWPTTRR